MRYRVKLHPRASKNLVIREAKDSLNVYVTDPPAQNKANRSLVGLLSQEFKVGKNYIKIITGLKSRNKIVEIK